MKSGAHTQQRRSIRLRGFDYSRPGAYFLTICAWQMKTIFGRVREGEMLLNSLGKLAHEEWLRTAEIRGGVQLDAFVVMPNHLHGVLILHPGCRGVRPYAPTTAETQLRSTSRTLGAIVRGFKAASARRINDFRGTPGQPVWQRNYFEHIVRNSRDLDEIRAYILKNPAKWEFERAREPGGPLPAPTTRFV
jgi:putative transposase